MLNEFEQLLTKRDFHHVTMARLLKKVCANKVYLPLQKVIEEDKAWIFFVKKKHKLVKCPKSKIFF